MENHTVMTAHKDITNMTGNHYVDEAVEFIKTKFCNDITVVDVASHVAVDRTYLFKLFCKYKGMAPSKYIRLVRISYAKELMDKREASLSDIPYLSGFQSSARFAEVFKNEYGMTPKAYIKMINTETSEVI